jgi:hypothetical protein
VQPLHHLGAAAQLARHQPAVAVALAEVGEDRVGLAEAEAVVVDHGHAAERVDREECRLDVLALEEIDELVPVRYGELLEGPLDLARVERQRKSPQRDHVRR